MHSGPFWSLFLWRRWRWSGRPARRRAAAHVFGPARVGGDSLCGADGLPVAGAAGQLSSLAELSPAVSGLARQRPMGADQRRAGAPEPSSPWARHHAYGSRPRFAERQNGAKRGQRGYDAGKRIKGRKRHIAVDRSGHLLAAVVHGAGARDSAGARLLLPQLAARYPTARTVYADGGYQGKLLDWASEVLGTQMSIIKPKGFQVLPKRWVVERTLAGLEPPPRQRLRTQSTLSRLLPVPRSRHGPATPHP